MNNMDVDNMEMKVNSKRCTGCGMCVIISPELFFLECHNPHPIAMARQEHLSRETAFARNAAMHCPSGAIVINRKTPPGPV